MLEQSERGLYLRTGEPGSAVEIQAGIDAEGAIRSRGTGAGLFGSAERRHDKAFALSSDPHEGFGS